jgi:hypothetical protein
MPFLPFQRVRSEAPNALWSPEAQPLARCVAVVRQLPTCEEKPQSLCKTTSIQSSNQRMTLSAEFCLEHI